MLIQINGKTMATGEYKETVVVPGKIVNLLVEDPERLFLARADKAEAQIGRMEEQVKGLRNQISARIADLIALQQVTGELCPLCGWAMRFPGEKCRCELAMENEQLRARVASPECMGCAHQERSGEIIRGLKDQIDLLTKDCIDREALELSHTDIIFKLKVEVEHWQKRAVTCETRQAARSSANKFYEEKK